MGSPDHHDYFTSIYFIQDLVRIKLFNDHRKADLGMFCILSFHLLSYDGISDIVAEKFVPFLLVHCPELMAIVGSTLVYIFRLLGTLLEMSLILEFRIALSLTEGTSNQAILICFE